MTDKFGRAISSGSSNSTTGITRSYVRANYIESNMEEDIDMKQQYKMKNLPTPTNEFDAVNKQYVDQKSYDYVPISEYDNTTIVRTNKNNNFNGNTIQGCESIYVNRDPQYDLELTTKQYVDTSIHQNSLLRLDPSEKLNNEFIKVFSLIDTKLSIEIPMKYYVDFHPRICFNDTVNDLNGNRITNVGNPEDNGDVATKSYVDQKGKKLLYDTTIFSNNTGTDLWNGWTLEVFGGINSVGGFFRSSNSTTSSTGTGPSKLPPTGTHYAFIEASDPNFGTGKSGIATKEIENLERVYFYYSRIGFHMCRFRLQYKAADDQWIDKLTFPQGEDLTTLTTEWVLLDIDFSTEYVKGIRFIFDEINNYESDMGISDINFEYING